jgi:hypothetical protein
MSRTRRVALIALAALVLLVVVGPLLVPVPVLENTRPPEELAGPDGRFLEINGLSVHYELYGQGEPFYVLLHGFGASTFSWREVSGPMAEMGTVLAYDRPASGLHNGPWSGKDRTLTARRQIKSWS